MSINLKIKKLHANAVIPSYATSGSAGLDLTVINFDESFVPTDFTVGVFKTGLSLEIPKGYVGMVYPRSGLSTKKGIVLANGTGVIDSDYRGELLIALRNLNKRITSFTWAVDLINTKVAQLVIMPVPQPTIEIVASLGETARGSGGFGSTGV
jgi:dUTP pyrophosphatase